MDRQCERCQKTFKYPSLLNRHKGRKTPCNAPGPPKTQPTYPCRKCGREFAQLSGRSRHEKARCPRDSESAPAPVTEVDRLRRELEAQRAEIEQLRRGATPGPDRGQDATIHGDHGTIDQSVTNVQVTLVVHGKEDMMRVSSATVREILQDGGTQQEVLGRIMRALFHDIPEHRNAYLPNEKSNKVVVYSGGDRWETRARTDILPKMVSQSANRLLAADYELLDVLTDPLDVKRTTW